MKKKIAFRCFIGLVGLCLCASSVGLAHLSIQEGVSGWGIPVGIGCASGLFLVMWATKLLDYIVDNLL